MNLAKMIGAWVGGSLALVAGVALLAGDADARPRTEWLGVTTACVRDADGIMTVRYNTQTLEGSFWGILHDDGKVQLEGKMENGLWRTFTVRDGYLSNGTEGSLRWNIGKLLSEGHDIKLYRLRHNGYTSIESSILSAGKCGA